MDGSSGRVHRVHFRYLSVTALCIMSFATPAVSAAPVKVRSLAAETLSDGRSVSKWDIRNASGAGLTVITLGAVIQTLDVPDKHGKLDDVVFGYESIAPYLDNAPHFGGVVGRFANRIAKGRFTLGGKKYQLALNNGPNALHGGLVGFDKQIWAGKPIKTAEGAGVILSRTSKDGEEGYPGTVSVSVSYIWTPNNRLIVDYTATTSAPTPFNIAQHSYFNLNGAGKATTILDHSLSINADRFTPVDATLIPTGELKPVAGTPFDFRKSKPIGRDIATLDEQLKFGGGYDHNWVVNGTGLRTAAVLASDQSGRRLTISSDQPGIQVYTGNFLDGKLMGKAGNAYSYRSGIALETQHYPNSPNQPNFPNVILKPGKPFHSRTIFTFSTDK
jgi:aldose 1-epimerase